MQEILRKIKAIKYRIKSLFLEKQEVIETYGLSSKGFTAGVAGGVKVSPQEATAIKLIGIDDRIKALEEQLEDAIQEFRQYLDNNIADSDIKLIMEQRLLWKKGWKEIDTIKCLSVSRKQQLFYETQKELEEKR